jgi:hypothetical protein
LEIIRSKLFRKDGVLGIGSTAIEYKRLAGRTLSIWLN